MKLQDYYYSLIWAAVLLGLCGDLIAATTLRSKQRATDDSPCKQCMPIVMHTTRSYSLFHTYGVCVCAYVCSSSALSEFNLGYTIVSFHRETRRLNSKTILLLIR